MDHPGRPRSHRRTRRDVPAIAVLLAALAAGCGAPPMDSIRLDPGAAWTPVAPATYLAPGRRLAAWSGPEGSSLVVYRTVPEPDGTAESVVETLANRFENLAGYRVVARRVQAIAGLPAARVEVVAPGTGGATAPSSIGEAIAPGGATLVPTREVTVGFPRPDGSLFLVWRLPEAARDRVSPEVEAALASLELPGPTLHVR